MKYFIYGFLAVVPLAFFSDIAFSAETRPYMYRTLQTAQLQSLLNAASPSVPVTYETVATTPAGQQVTRYTTRNTVMNATRLGSIARSAVGGPAILAATAAFIAYDYFYDDDSGTWQSAPTPPGDIDYSSDSTGCRINSSTYTPNYSLSDCISAVQATFPFAVTFTTAQLVSSGPTNREYALCYTDNDSNLLCFPANRAWRFNPSLDSIDIPAEDIDFLPQPVSDSNLGDAVIDATPQQVSDILNDPIQSGTWPDRWPELLPNVQDIEDQLGHDIEGAPAPVNPDQTITDGSTSAPPETSTDSGGSMSTEWPTFCSWAGVVCTFIDWVQEPFEEPAPVDIPYVEIDFEEDYDSGIGIPNCPAPISIVTQFGEVQFDWSNTCSLAEMIKPLVIAFSYLIGIYILLRVK